MSLNLGKIQLNRRKKIKNDLKEERKNDMMCLMVLNKFILSNNICLFKSIIFSFILFGLM